MSYNPNNPNGQATTASSAPVTISSNQPKFPVEIADTQSDIHGQLIGVTRITQIVTKFFQQTPQSCLNISIVGTGAATNGTGTAIFSTGTGATASVLAQTPVTIIYSAQYEAWGVLSGAFTTPTTATTTFQKLGLYNAVDGYAFGFNGLIFGVFTRVNGVDTFIAQTSWNKDILTGASGSTFKSNGLPVALVPTNINMYRIRYGWYGAVNTYFEVYAPDGNWVTVHVIRTANSQVSVNITNPNLPLTVEISKSASDATNLAVICGGWAAGVTAPATGIFMQGQQLLAALNAALTLPTTGLSSLSFSITGTWVGTLAFQYSMDGLNWFTTNFLENQTGLNVNQTTVNNNYIATVSTQRYHRIVVIAWTSGTASIAYFGSSINSAKQIQPVSLATNTPDVIDRAARLLGFVTANEGAAIATGVTILQNATAATSNGTSLVVTGYGTAVLQITGTFVATINFEFSIDGGTTWNAISATQIGAGDIFQSTTIAGSFRITCTALDLIRARVTWTSGTVTINGRASNAINASKVVKLATGINTIGKAYITDGTNSVGITSANIGGNETTLDRLKVNASLRMIDTSQTIGSQLVGATGTQAGGLNVNIKNTSVPVTGTFFQATQPVSIATTITGDVTDRATRLLGVLSPSTNTIGKVGIDQTTQGVTNAVSVTSQPEAVITGTITTTDTAVAAPSTTGVLLSGTSTAGSYVAMSAAGGNASVVIGVTNLTTGTIYYEGSADSTTGVDGNWVALNMKQAGYINTQISSSTIVNGLFRGNTAGIRYIRMRSVGTLTGTPVITLRLSAGVAGEFLFGSIPTGTNTIGVVNVAGTIPVTGTFFQTTQPVSIASMPSTPVTGTFFQTTQPVSGAFFQATQPVSIATSVPVTGTFFQATQPVSIATTITGDVTDRATRLLGVISTGANTIGAVNINGTIPVTGTFFQATQPVSIVSMPSTPVTGTFFQTTQPVSGAFFQTTQPVSIASMPSTPVTGTFFQATQPVSLATNTPTLAAGTNIVGKVGIDQTTPGTTNLISIGTNGTVAINTALPTGTNTIGAVNIAAAQTLANVTTVATVTSVTSITNALPTGANVLGKTSIDQTTLGTTNAIQAIPGTTNGLTTFHLVSAASTNPTVLKAAVGQVYGWYIYNSNTAARKVAFHNTAAAPTAGAAVFFSLIVPPSSGANVHLTTGISFSTGIAITTTTGLADADTVAVALNDLVINIFYK